MKLSKPLILGIAALAAALTSGAQERQLSDLPTLYIERVSDDHPIDKVTYQDCSLEFIGADSDTVFADGRIRGRGNSTWVRGNKLPYKIKFYAKHRLLGEDGANAKKWNLMANNFDKTLLRNSVASFIALKLGQNFAPGSRFVDLVLDGRFVGNYQITDQIDIRKRRIHITEQELPADETSNITGGYLLECINDEWGPTVIYSDYGSTLDIKSPDEDVINDAQRNYIRNHINKFETRLFGGNFADPEKGYRPMVDSLSLASWYLTNELAINPDTFWSSFIYKECDDDRIFFGPVWDFDIAFNNSVRLGDATDRLMADVGFHSYSNAGVWIGRMRQDPWFNALLSRQWHDAVEAGLEESVIAYIDSMAAVLNASQKLNYEIYDINQAYWDEMVLFNSYSEGVDFLKTTISNRIAFMNECFAPKSGGDDGTDPPGEVRFIIPGGAGGYHIYNLGTLMPVAPGVKDYPAIRDVTDPRGDEFIWDLIPEGAYFRIVNRSTGLAIADRGGQSHGQALTMLTPADSPEQLWNVKPLYNAENTCVVANVATDLAWNNSGGHAIDGNAIISWTNDAANRDKPTRQWGFVLVDEPGEEDGIAQFEETDYCVTYSASAQCLRFVATGSGSVSGTFEIYTMSGRKVMAGMIAPEISLGALPGDAYILRWRSSSRPRVLKFLK